MTGENVQKNSKFIICLLKVGVESKRVEIHENCLKYDLVLQL